MGESSYANSNLGNDLIRTIFATIDRPVYWLLGLVYQLFFNVATANILSGENMMRFYGRVQLIIGVFMMFQLAMTFLRGIVNPDAITDSKSGGANLIIRICTSLLLLIAITPIRIASPQNEFETQLNNNGLLFGALYSLQYRLLNNNTLGRLVLGTESSSSDYFSGDTSSSESLETSSRIFASTILKGFYRINLKPADERTKHDDTKDDAVFNDNRMCEDIDDEVLNEYTRVDADTGKILEMVNENCTVDFNLWNYFPKASSIFGTKKYVFTMMPLVSTITGVIFVLILLSFTVDVAVRSIKLAILRLLAPIPIISYMDPKGSKDSSFNAWQRLLWSTYLDLFIRIALVYFILYMIQDMILNGLSIQSSTGVLGVLSLILIWIALFMFAKETPKFIKQALGMKDDGGKVFSGLGTILGAGAVAAGTVGSAATNWRAAKEENDELHQGQKVRNGFRNAGSAIAGAIGGAYVGGRALAGKDGNARSVIAAQNQRNAQRAAHSTLPGRIASSGYGLITGRGLSELGNQKLKSNQDAFKAFKDYKTTIEDEALKKTNFYGKDKTGSGNLYNYSKLQAAVERARNSGADTFTYSDGVHTYTGLRTDAFDTNTMNDIKSSQAEAYADKLMTDRTFASTEGTAWNSYLMAQKAAATANNSTFDGRYGTTKQAMGEVKSASTTAETDMKQRMRRANDQAKK